MRKAYMKLLAFGLILLICSAVYAQGTEKIRNMSITPNPMEKHTDITVDFNAPCDVHMYIEDGAGNVICDLYDGVASKELVIGWDRLDNDGNYVAEGKYSVVLDYSTRYTSTKKTLILK